MEGFDLSNLTACVNMAAQDGAKRVVVADDRIKFLNEDGTQVAFVDDDGNYFCTV